MIEQIVGKRNASLDWDIYPMKDVKKAAKYLESLRDSGARIAIRLRPQEHLDRLTSEVRAHHAGHLELWLRDQGKLRVITGDKVNGSRVFNARSGRADVLHYVDLEPGMVYEVGVDAAVKCLNPEWSVGGMGMLVEEVLSRNDQLPDLDAVAPPPPPRPLRPDEEPQNDPQPTLDQMLAKMAKLEAENAKLKSTTAKKPRKPRKPKADK
jgi:hypothetical protein